jgi:hypothetical protein
MVVCWRENEAAQDDDWVERSLGAKTSSQEQGPDFDLVGISQTVIVHEAREAVRTTCWSGSSPIGCISIWVTMTLLVMSGHLSIAVIS